MLKLTGRTRVFATGDSIIHEGDRADFVFLLQRGRAAAYQAGTKVGDILPGETFGALAAFCGTPRNASVRASTLCRVEAFSTDQFIAQARRQPELCVKLIHDMARLIGDLNESIRLLHSDLPRTPLKTEASRSGPDRATE